jgi:hypothetical protein
MLKRYNINFKVLDLKYMKTLKTKDFYKTRAN